MKYIISVSKTYKHRGKNVIHRDKTKKYWQIMYYEINEDGEWQLYSKFVNVILALYYRTQKRHRVQGTCSICGITWIFFVKSGRETLVCPNCDELDN